MSCDLKKMLCLAGGLILVAVPARAAFIDTLSPQERAASGLDRLSPAQISALDRLVAHDEVLAREGDVTGFATSFTERRTHLHR